jgi:hypothetical protein
MGKCCDASALRALPNVRLLGQKPHGEVPRYVRCFDACLIEEFLGSRSA